MINKRVSAYNTAYDVLSRGRATIFLSCRLY